jgi:outer membrane protein assembly factor BamB
MHGGRVRSGERPTRGARRLGIALLTVLAVPAPAAEWPTYAGGPRRLFFNPAETTVTRGNVGALEVKWTFPTGAIVTASPSVVDLDVPNEGRIAVAFIQSWDGNLYALRARNGTELWRFEAAVQPGKSYPNAGSVDVTAVDGLPCVFYGAGETLYALDAVTGVERWRFDAGTGCVDPPGLCAFDGERNEIESSPAVVAGRVLFGMDVNDRAGGKGGFYALAARDGRLEWYFDVATGRTCRPLPGDDIRRFDGYHTEVELGLPAGFLATRPGCDFDRTGTGCGNVWSSAAVDESRGVLYFASSNCDTDDNPATLTPPPPMPPWDEAVVALDLDGNPRWRWRPREIDNDDLAFGGVPNLFAIDVATPGGTVRRDVVGVGNKDGAYYVIDRDGANIATGTRWDDPDPRTLPYWTRRLVAGGPLGGIIATAAVDEARGRVYVSTAPGFDPLAPQRPTVHALDATTGAILWQNTGEANADASFAPVSAIPGAVFVGTVVGGFVRAYDPDTGVRLAHVAVGAATAGAPAVVDGLVMLGAGVGERGNPSSLADMSARIPQPVTALCVPGTPACQRLAAFACRRGRTTRGVEPPASRATTTLTDRFGSGEARVKGTAGLCSPADVNAEDAAAASDPDHLRSLPVRWTRRPGRLRPAPTLEVVDRFGTFTMQPRRPSRLLVPSAVRAGGAAVDEAPAPRIDAFQCYEARARPRRRRVRDVAVTDARGRAVVYVLQPKQLCVPTDQGGEAPGAEHHRDLLACHRLKVRGARRRPAAGAVSFHDALGAGTLHLSRLQLLCVPATTTGPSGGSSTTTTTSVTTTTVAVTTTTLLLTWPEVQAILAASCASCHGGEETRGGLGGLDDLERAYDNMVNVPSVQVPGLDLIEPFSAGLSYLVHKLDGTHESVGGSGGPMPLAALLPPADRDGIRAWIGAGAER